MSEVEDWVMLVAQSGLDGRQFVGFFLVPSLIAIALTLLDAVLLGALVILILLLAGDALNALIVVVLVGSADGGVGAL